MPLYKSVSKWVRNGLDIYNRNLGGRVGIGTRSPGQRLHVDASIATQYAIIQQDATHNIALGWWYDANPADAYGMLVTFAFSNPLKIDGSDVLLQTRSGGNVGIGVSDPHSKLEVVGAISSSIKTISASADNTDVSGVNTLFVSTSGGHITLGGLSGGVTGQRISIIKMNAANSLTVEHYEATGVQKFIMHTGADETLGDGDFGGYEFIYSGTLWFDVAHARHV